MAWSGEHRAFAIEEFIWFQQDGAMAYTSRRSLAVLRNMFPGHVVFLLGDIGWPPRSLDLTPCDYFLWGYLKAKAFQHRPRNMEALKEAIRNKVAAILPEMVRRVMENFRGRLTECINNGDRHLSKVLFKSR